MQSAATYDALFELPLTPGMVRWAKCKSPMHTGRTFHQASRAFFLDWYSKLTERSVLGLQRSH